MNFVWWRLGLCNLDSNEYTCSSLQLRRKVDREKGFHSLSEQESVCELQPISLYCVNEILIACLGEDGFLRLWTPLLDGRKNIALFLSKEQVRESVLCEERFYHYSLCLT
jgi:hypothetical protein